VLLGVRPENIVLDPAGYPSQVQVVEPTGPETFVMLEAFGVELLASLRDQPIPELGDTLRIAFQLEKLHVFDPASGQRI
jgi:multiple sugar transport system ATP-binding protein